jgi:hypothetical protein
LQRTERDRTKQAKKEEKAKTRQERSEAARRRSGRMPGTSGRARATGGLKPTRARCAYFGRKTLGFCSTHYRARRLPALQSFLYEVRLIVSPARLRAVWIGCVWRLLIFACYGMAGVGDAEVVLGVLIVILDGDTVIADRSFPCERDVPLKNLMGATADFDVGDIAVEGLASLWRSLLLWEWPVAVIARAGRALG